MRFSKKIAVAGTLVVLSLLFSGCGSKVEKTSNNNQVNSANYPQKAIKIVSHIPVGAAPDKIFKQIASLMESKLGQKVEVVSSAKTPAEAFQQVWSAPHDGYTVLAHTENIFVSGVSGDSTHTVKDWTFFEISQDMSVIAVRSDSEYKNVSDLIEAAKKNPNGIKIGYPASGKVFYLKMKALEKVAGVQFDYVSSYKSSIDLISALNNKQIDAAVVTVPYISKGISESKIRPLTILDINLYGSDSNTYKIDSIINEYPEYKKYLPMTSVLGFAMPADTPKNVVDTFGKAFDEVMNEDSMKNYFSNQNTIKVDLWGANTDSFMSKMESNYSWLTKDLGMAKVDPESLNIPRPQ